MVMCEVFLNNQIVILLNTLVSTIFNIQHTYKFDAYDMLH